MTWLTRSPNMPITLWQINSLPENAKKRLYHALLPPDLLTRFGIHPMTWKGPAGDQPASTSRGPVLGTGVNSPLVP